MTQCIKKIIKKTSNQVLKFVQPMFPSNRTKSVILNSGDISDESVNGTRYPDTQEHKFKLRVLGSVNKSTLNIFLVESRCGTRKLAAEHLNKGFVLTPRQCCAVESAALAHPQHSVYILHTCPLPTHLDLPAHGKVLSTLPNVFILNPPLEQIFQGTPLEEFFLNNIMESSDFPVFHSSDIIRLILLWRFGGTYLDLDVIVLRSLEKLGTNFAGFESPGWIANGIMNFEPTGSGHEIVETALLYLKDHYDPQSYSDNGPVMMTKLLKKECYRFHQTEQCDPMSLYIPRVLYPLSWSDRFDLVNSSVGPQVFDAVTRSAFTVHCWNGSTANKTVTVGSSQAYALLADKYCPQVYRNCGVLFQ